MDILTNDINQCNLEIVDELVCNLKSYVEESATRGVAVHQVEETLFRQLFLIGQQALGCFLASKVMETLAKYYEEPMASATKSFEIALAAIVHCLGATS